MSFDIDPQQIQDALGDGKQINIQNMLALSLSGQPCDITFRNRKPLIDVVIDRELHYALMYGAGPEKISKMLPGIKLKGGGSFDFSDVWTINPMPKGGISKQELDSVDLSDADTPIGPNGESMRKMISDTYHCETAEETEYYLRRFYAS
ncbi:transposase [Pseudomonas aeruginosa]|uniref:hypothetical protein n=1 Tax=Pseudomonas aeruginosa TaxID=287 RepID=UPI0003B95B58|nr:hypothetical protein [Pseudomonas aeruginosa]ELL0593983.1 transposase [Pseudomonas aeruginosa]ELY1879106.1 transposase [Pseudomonas aeruginosa]ERY71415.1 hypothetical protein Q055_02200 [Pseudomonas aeruginosa BL01]MBU5936830.1 transposase [Pseudomonas aeruginosa]MCO3041443.1 transposase [Pseudomonas aeruginosa]